jgi:hypothetical protein
MHEQLHQSAGDASFNDGLDLIIGSIGKVRDGPASINQDLIVKGVDELGQDRKGGGNSSPVRLGSLATAEVAKSPSSIAEHAQLTAIAEKVKKRLKGATAKDIVTAVRAVTSNVTKSPDSLFPNIGLGASKELNEDGNSASLNNDLGLCGGARGNVGQSPSSLELNQGVRGSQELDETANNTGLDDLLNRGVTLLGKKLSELGGGLNLRIDLVREDALHHLGKVLIQLRLGRSGVIIAIGGGTKRSTRTVLTGSDTSSLGQVLLTLGLSDLDLLLLTATTELLRLEGVLRLELSAAMLGDVSLSHDDCYCFGPRGRW